MSRTYRKREDWVRLAYGRYWTWEEEREFIKENWPEARTWWITLGWSGRYFLDRKGRDEKPGHKAPKWFKQCNRRCERGKVRDAINAGKEVPLFRKSDSWDWS
jgi:hypothetical protein